MHFKVFGYTIILAVVVFFTPVKAELIDTDSLLTIINSLNNDTGRVNTLNVLGKGLIDKMDYDKGLIYSREAKKLAEKLNYKKGMAQALTNEGIILSKKKQYRDAIELHKQALKISNDLKDDYGIRYSNYYIGACYQWLNLYKEASELFFKSTKLAEAANDSFLLYKSLSSTAYLLQFMGNYNESISYEKKSLQYINDSHKGDYCIGQIFMADYFALNGQPDEADSVLVIALGIAQELNSPYHLSYYYNIKSEIDAQRGNLGQAILDLKNSNKYEMMMPASANLPYNYANIANFILKCDNNQLQIAGIPKHKKFDESISYALKSLDITIPAGIIYITSSNYYHLSVAYKSKADFEKALKYYELHRTIHDSLFQVKNMETIQELKLKYESEKKEQKISLLENENKIKSLAEQSQKQRTNFALAGIVILVVTGFYVYTLYRNRKKLSEQLRNSYSELKQMQEQLITIEKEKEAENTRLAISRDLHDDLGATLSSISVFSAAAKQRLNDNNTEQVYRMLDQISNDAQEMATSVSERVWMMKPQKITLENLVEHLQLFASSVLTAKNISFQFNCDEKIKNKTLSSEQRKNIYLIFKEAINNAAKYSQGNNVEFNATADNDKLSIVLSDNGIGLNDNSTGAGYSEEGNGLENMKERAKEINASLNIISSQGKGTVINLLCPLPTIEDKIIE